MKKSLVPVMVAILFLASCGSSTNNEERNESSEAPKSMLDEQAPTDPMKNMGIGPISSIILTDELDQNMADAGRIVFEQMCTACHKPNKNFIGPAPKDILSRRTPEWVMNMILNPEEMTQKDPIARALLIEFNGAPMANQNLSEEQARQVLEYFRTL